MIQVQFSRDRYTSSVAQKGCVVCLGSFGMGEAVQTEQVTYSPEVMVKARRTAFVARFVVLRESKRTRSHRIIEMMEWDEFTTAEELYERFRHVFVENGDNMTPVDRDLRRALAHAQRAINHFIPEYAARATGNFIDSLYDYERSNSLLFGAEDQPKPGGWRLPKELARDRLKILEKQRKLREQRSAATP
jgi:hypothetical protein